MLTDALLYVAAVIIAQFAIGAAACVLALPLACIGVMGQAFGTQGKAKGRPPGRRH